MFAFGAQSGVPGGARFISEILTSEFSGGRVSFPKKIPKMEGCGFRGGASNSISPVLKYVREDCTAFQHLFWSFYKVFTHFCRLKPFKKMKHIQKVLVYHKMG